MRSEQEILDLILNIAEDDDRVRVVIMNGSRVNPNVPSDILQDFDVLYLVTDMAPFRNNHEWIKQFGELMIMQMPEGMGDARADHQGRFAYLMQFADGNRIDLSLYPVEKLGELHRDSLSRLLLDKDGLVQPFPQPDESDYLPKPPTEMQYLDCCNEFWWVSMYVAKGLWRGEILYVKFFLDDVLREQLMIMLTWQIGIQTWFKVNPGYHGKFFKKYLTPEEWDALMRTFSNGDYEHSWVSLFEMCDLFRKAAILVGNLFGFEYPTIDDEKVSAHLKHLRHLPKDAPELY